MSTTHNKYAINHPSTKNSTKSKRPTVSAAKPNQDKSLDHKNVVLKVENKEQNLKNKSNVNQTAGKIKENETGENKNKTSIRSRNDKLAHPTLKRQSHTLNKVDTSKKVTSTSHIKLDKATTQLNSRMAKTQYFPTKALYHNALLKTRDDPKSDKNFKKNMKEHNETFTKKEPESTSDSSSMSERPRTATLRKGSIVNENIVGPDAPNFFINRKILAEEVIGLPSELEAYEDDFDSYESDFEHYSSSESTINNISEISTEDTSSSTNSVSNLEHITIGKRSHSAETDDERKLDSGNFDLNDMKRKQLLNNFKGSMENDNFIMKNKEDNKNNSNSFTDEGFEEAKSLQFINFLRAKKDYEHKKCKEKMRKRGQEILNMIRLDTVTYTLFELPSVPYEEFIKKYGKTNCIQMSTQTKGHSIDEEVQTDNIECCAKWTQIPTKFSKIEDSNFSETYKSDRLGTGSETIMEENEGNTTNQLRLEQFLITAGGVMLNFLEQQFTFSKNDVNKTSEEIIFSESFMQFQIKTNELLKNRIITHVAFNDNDPNMILSIHYNSESEVADNIICVWNINYMEYPKMYLSSHGKISCCSFGADSSDIIFAGLENGLIVVWNAKDTATFHMKVNSEIDHYNIRSPTYTSEIVLGHCSKVVSIQPFQESTNIVLNLKLNRIKQICSLDEDGDLLLWSIIRKHEIGRNEISCTSHWENVVLALNHRIRIKEMYPEYTELNCTEMRINSSDSNHVYIATNHGFIIHYLLNGEKVNQKTFISDDNLQVNCLELCPFSQLYFLAGFESGNINLYSRESVMPLMVMSNKDNTNGKIDIDIILWSKEKPCLFYTKDTANTIDIWDLNESNIFPIASIPCKENIACMALSPMIRNGNECRKSSLVIASQTELFLHILNQEHGRQAEDVYIQQLKTFMNYVNRL